MAEFSRPRKTPLRGPWTSLGIGGGARATLTTALAGTNNDIKYTSKERGPDGNGTRVRYVVAGNNTPLSVTVTGRDITVNVATSGVGAATSTGAQVRDAVNGNAAASALVLAENATGNDGTGVVAALGFTNLAGGANSLPARGSGAFTRVKRGGTTKNG